MQGMHAFEPNAKASIDLESFVAQDHFLRRIDLILDLSFLRELTAGRFANAVSNVASAELHRVPFYAHSGQLGFAGSGGGTCTGSSRISRFIPGGRHTMFQDPNLPKTFSVCWKKLYGLNKGGRCLRIL